MTKQEVQCINVIFVGMILYHQKKDRWLEWIPCPLEMIIFIMLLVKRFLTLIFQISISMTDKFLSTEKENLEDLTVIWLDEHSQDRHTKARLRCIINFLKIFTELNLCLDYINSIHNEHIFLIVSGRLSSQLIPLVQDRSQIVHIYIFCQDSDRYSSLQVRGIFIDQELLYNQLSKDANQFYATHSTVISFATEKSLRDLTKETGTFLWFQLFITALFDMSPSSAAKQDILKLARTFYADNDLELQRIDRFDRTYKAVEALKWYSSDSFVYRLLNKAIRTENIDLLFACRFFIVDLHRQLTSLHESYIERLRSSNLNEHKVYHGQLMTEDDFTKLQTNVNQLISINSFLSTSIDPDVALIFSGNDAIHSTMKSVLFEITINVAETMAVYRYPFADISAYSNFTEEKEVLFSLGAMFRIEDISKRA